MNNYQHKIPQMTHPLSKGWSQPDTTKILITDVRAVMSKKIFDDLAEYTTSIPTGVYAGKMWKANTVEGVWILRWYEYDSAVSNRCLIKQKIIYILPE